MVDIDLVQIYSTIYNIGGNKEQATEKATVDATEMQQEERPEIQEIIENNATNLTEFQGKLLQEIIKQAKEGRINKSKLADILNVERSTIYRNWDSVYSHVQSLNGNLKGAV
jgi:predicted transcriptional regulator